MGKSWSWTTDTSTKSGHPHAGGEIAERGGLLDACRGRRPRRLLIASTAAVYPADGGPFAEDHAPGPIDVYGYTKLMDEDLARLYVADTGNSRVRRIGTDGIIRTVAGNGSAETSGDGLPPTSSGIFPRA